MFEVLMFLFENYMGQDISLSVDNETLFQELGKVGFERYEIDKALGWLDGLVRMQELVCQGPKPLSHTIRYYSAIEQERIGVKGRGFLLYLEQLNILDSETREIVIDRVLALDGNDIDLGRVKWVALMVLFNKPNKKDALHILQDMILAEDVEVLH